MRRFIGGEITNRPFNSLKIFEIKDDEHLVLISKSEKEAIRAKFPKVNIVRTMKQRSKRHRYYCEEAPQVMRYLNELRRKDVAYAAGSKRKRV